MENRFIRAEDVAEELNVSKPYAYELIRQLNEELKAKGPITIAGRCKSHSIFTKGSTEQERGKCQCRYLRMKITVLGYVMARYVNWKGETQDRNASVALLPNEKHRNGKECVKLQTSSDLDMSFEAFTELYINDVKNRLKENTWLTKEHIIRTKILPYFGKLKISEISTKEIITWQK